MQCKGLEARRGEGATMMTLSRLPHGGLGAERRLGGATPSRCQFADVIQEDRALQCVELRGVGRDLGEEGIGHENGCLVAMAGGCVAQQGRDVDLKSFREAGERGQGWHGLAVLDLGDIGAGDVHAASELPLRQVADVTQIADGRSYLKTTLLLGLWWDESEWGWCRFRHLNFEGFAAATAERAGDAELHQTTVVTTQNLTLFDRCHHGCHKLCVAKGPRARTQHMSDNGTCDVPRVTLGKGRVKGKPVDY